MIYILKDICLITCSDSEAFVQPLFNMERILCSFSNLSVIIGSVRSTDETAIPKCTRLFKVRHRTSKYFFFRILWYVLLQLKISAVLVKASSRSKLIIFFMEGDAILPVLISKILGLKIIRVLPSSISLKMAELNHNILLKLIVYLNNVSYSLSDKIILYSSNLINEWGLQKFSSKISIAHEHFLDLDKFNIQKKFNERDLVIGYIGRMSHEKGIFNLVESIPEILNQRKELKFILGGTGVLSESIQIFLNSKKLDNKVKLVGWISHDNIPYYLNELKLLILPSFTEGLPNIILEAMACGTPVLATSVGAIPDIIKDEETGFTMENNSPKCILENVFRALEYSDLGKISENARKLMESEYRFEVTVDKFKQILDYS